MSNVNLSEAVIQIYDKVYFLQYFVWLEIAMGVPSAITHHEVDMAG